MNLKGIHMFIQINTGRRKIKILLQKPQSNQKYKKEKLQKPNGLRLIKHMYVSNLPTAITEQEFIDLMQKCLSTEIWDDKTKSKIAETDAQINERLRNWDNFLEENNKKQSSSSK
ncbi:hypothetical protein BDFB_001989 [Asbolus verrucosus]|uniref:Uncharacterized protein n=1 Tax=Asbolus verrucosus TaxID=1661398 RepID=A0A482V865_ASBVE|nr:hypothetical protein BDFB_001989 [Asbolus verrucosus]